jgi:hypothetical protein
MYFMTKTDATYRSALGVAQHCGKEMNLREKRPIRTEVVRVSEVTRQNGGHIKQVIHELYTSIYRSLCTNVDNALASMLWILLKL